MELDLSLGDSSKPLIGFMENQHREASNELGLGFNTTLSIGPVITTQTDQQQQIKTKTNNNSNSTENPNPVLNQLDLLPPLSFPWHSPSENVGSLLVSTEFGGSSRGLDVNVVPLAVVVAEDEAALSSSPNSAASSFQMDLCIYSGGGGGGSLSGSGGNKREFSDGEGYYQRNCSRVSDDDDNCGGGNTRKKLRLSKDQSAFLEESFKEHNTLNPKQKLALAKSLNLSPRQVEVWFQNRRARTKLKQTEVDCEYLKRCCETLTEENRRLHKELQELRALKTSNPFNMQLPATTLTMCPSCERVATNSTATSSVTTSATIKTSDDSTSKSNNNIGFPFGKPRIHQHHLELN
ncbi:homeobox-leucine zipper protein HAT14-like [Cicer arietinum]|uniref:Homeobox-leucine zipper protein HOX11-like n=1 Tax=Cicer arietinum TaxID=3827 RepID=A0A1S2XFA8_CICAR|nr:homeobox-leucine zipper protein HOX11-like [Cicer arietinum]